jgi:hypothetical protein
MSTLQVDRIIPYLSASVTIEGAIQANAATTGSNTFVGDQNIQGTLTASIQEGFVLAGGVGDVSTLVATSSFGGGSGDGFPYTGDAVITGSLTISGSSLYDVTIDGKQQIIGTTSGAGAPVLLISSSDANILATRQSVTFRTPGKDFNSNAAQGTLYFTNNTIAELTLGVFDEPNFVNDVELNIRVTSGSGVQFKDWDNASAFDYETWLQIAPNLGNSPTLEFKRNIEVTGSVDISSVLKLAGQDPLPANEAGQLAVSASNLYYNDGSTWTQIN